MTNDTHDTKGNAPGFHAFAVREIAEGDSQWTRIGAAFVHADGKGMSLVLNCLPINNRIVLRASSDRPTDHAAE